MPLPDLDSIASSKTSMDSLVENKSDEREGEDRKRWLRVHRYYQICNRESMKTKKLSNFCLILKNPHLKTQG